MIYKDGPCGSVTVRLPNERIRMLDLVALGLALRAKTRISRSEALRRLMDPIFDALLAKEDVKAAIRKATKIGAAAFCSIQFHDLATTIPDNIKHALDDLEVEDDSVDPLIPRRPKRDERK